MSSLTILACVADDLQKSSKLISIFRVANAIDRGEQAIEIMGGLALMKDSTRWRCESVSGLRSRRVHLRRSQFVLYGIAGRSVGGVISGGLESEKQRTSAATTPSTDCNAA